ncbi:hypothetical protein CCR95_04105 [Thiocystis minor]|nr:hypothetical protein [Thiocystis minor]
MTTCSRCAGVLSLRGRANALNSYAISAYSGGKSFRKSSNARSTGLGSWDMAATCPTIRGSPRIFKGLTAMLALMGVHLAVDRLQGFMRQVTANGQRRAWYLQLDIRNYFMSIDKALLWRLLEPRIDDPDARWLTELLVFHDCTQDYVYKGRPGELERVPPHKTLLRAEPGKGLPIGNLNSQFFANVYLNGLDQFVKHELKCPHYLRYCDDFVLLSPDPDQLSEWRERIREYLWTERLLRLNPTRERLRPLSDGVDFLGYIVRREYRLVRRRVVNALKARLRDARERLVSVREGVAWYRFDAPELERLRAVLASYLGHFQAANTWRLWRGIRAAHPWLDVYFEWDEAARKLQPRDAMPKALTRACQQYAWARGRFPGDALLFQVGAFYEVYDRRDAVLARDLGLRALRENPRHALYGFPERLFGRYLSRLLALGRPVVVVAQGEHAWTGVRERRLVWRIVPARIVAPDRFIARLDGD